MKSFQTLTARASIRIYEYGIHTRSEMMGKGRNFPFYVMSYLAEGSAMLRIYGQEIELPPRSVIIIPPHVEHDHYMITQEPSTFLWWHFDYKIYDTIDLLSLLHLPIVYTVKNPEQFESLFYQYSQAMQLPDSMKNTLHRLSCILEVLGHLLDEIEREYGTNEDFLGVPSIFCEILETIISGENNSLSLPYFAEKYNLHPTYISNRFTQYFGISPIRLHRKLQLERAAQILESSDKTVGEVAEMFGFNDISTFSRHFKAVMGFSPSNIKSRSSSVLQANLSHL